VRGSDGVLLTLNIIKNGTNKEITKAMNTRCFMNYSLAFSGFKPLAEQKTGGDEEFLGSGGGNYFSFF
jgi:hypothetical protein